MDLFGGFGAFSDHLQTETSSQNQNRVHDLQASMWVSMRAMNDRSILST